MPQLAADVQHDLFVVDHPFPVVLAPIVGGHQLPFFDAAPVWIFAVASVRVPYRP